MEPAEARVQESSREGEHVSRDVKLGVRRPLCGTSEKLCEVEEARGLQGWCVESVTVSPKMCLCGVRPVGG